MSDAIQNPSFGSKYLLRRAKSSVPTFRFKPGGFSSQPKLKRQPSVVLLVDENCPVHGCKGKCSCPSESDNQGSLGNTDSFYQNDYNNEQQIYENCDNSNDYASTSIKPFNNNPPLPYTQKNVVGNNFQFNPSTQSTNWNGVNDEQLGSLMIYRDALKQNLTTPYKAGGSSLPKMRLGRAGGFWRHIKQTNTYSGSNLAFVDGFLSIKFLIVFFSILIYLFRHCTS
ncbi:hypothetical protein I4U23_020444 [Adineta vaga]|nr:hypothetical protein I4U23_020444 [Adineta vaga]